MREAEGRAPVPRWRRRIARWSRRRRAGLWLAVVLVLAAVAYALVYFGQVTSRYQPLGYEPKDIERQRLLEQEAEAGRAPWPAGPSPR